MHATVLLTSRVSVSAMVWTETGAPPPIATPPSMIRRVVALGAARATSGNGCLELLFFISPSLRLPLKLPTWGIRFQFRRIVRGCGVLFLACFRNLLLPVFSIITVAE